MLVHKQKGNRDWFRLRQRMNSFNKPQSNNGRVCWLEKKDTQEIDNKIISLKHQIIITT